MVVKGLRRGQQQQIRRTTRVLLVPFLEVPFEGPLTVGRGSCQGFICGPIHAVQFCQLSRECVFSPNTMVMTIPNGFIHSLDSTEIDWHGPCVGCWIQVGLTGERGLFSGARPGQGKRQGKAPKTKAGQRAASAPGAIGS